MTSILNGGVFLVKCVLLKDRSELELKLFPFLLGDNEEGTLCFLVHFLIYKNEDEDAIM